MRIPLALFCLFPSLLLANQTVKLQAPLFDNLGSFHYKISTNNPLAQRFFDQGLVFFYGFEWGESIRSFKEAIRIDPNCGMCYWGMALALGSKINAPISGHEYQSANNAIKKALSLQKYETPVEQAYIHALSLRFQHEPHKIKPADGAFRCHMIHDASDLSSKKEILNYAQSMEKLTVDYPQEINAKNLYVFAMFEAINWTFWDPNRTINPATLSLIATLKTVLNKDKLNIGANHYYIHILEQSPKPEEALESANSLGNLVPDSEHLIHMPAHIYFLTGRYHEASEANLRAISAFKNYNKVCIAQGFKPEINYLYFHNYDFLRSSLVMEGRSQLALSVVREMLKNPFPIWLANDSSLQWFLPIPYFVEVRFGMWNSIFNEPKPSKKYPYALGMWHYARGIASVHTSNIKNAESELSELNKIIEIESKNGTIQNNKISCLQIAVNLLKAVVSDFYGNEKATINLIKIASTIQHDMGYHEPPDWYFPTKEALGDAYLKWNHPMQAIKSYKECLQQYPQNGWILFGLAKSLFVLGKNYEAKSVEDEFNKSWSHADITAPVSLLTDNKFKNNLDHKQY